VAAQDILNYINKMQKPAANETPKVAADTGFVYAADSMHQFMIVIDNKAINAEMLKIKISNFNNKYYSMRGFTISNAFLTAEKQYILVKSFANCLRSQCLL
jgi:hypothetical protein